MSSGATGLLLAQAVATPQGGSLSLNVTGGGSTAVKLFLLLTLLSFATTIILSITSFARISIVLGFLRQALGTPQVPPNQILMGLALTLTAYVMAPTATAVWDNALSPYLNDEIEYPQALERASGPIRTFLLKHTDERDLRLFYEVSGRERPASSDEVPLTVAVPAFMTSELSTSFRMGMYIFIPFLLIDLLISSVLMSLGMAMLPPQMVSLPVKIGIFLLADGWRLIIGGLARSFG